MTIGETIDHALKIRDEIKKETGKHLELAVSTFSFGTNCESIEIRAYYKPEGEEKWWVMKRAFDRHILEVDGKGLIDLFFIDLKRQMSFTDKHRPAQQQTCKNCKYFHPEAEFQCSVWCNTAASYSPGCFQFTPKEQ